MKGVGRSAPLHAHDTFCVSPRIIHRSSFPDSRVASDDRAAREHRRTAMQIGEIRDLERSLQDALDYKFISSPKTPQDVAGLFDIVYKPPK